MLRDIEEQDTEQTAELLGMTQSAVKVRLPRATRVEAADRELVQMNRTRSAMGQMMNAMMGPHEDAGPRGLRFRGWMMRHVSGMLTCADFENFVYDYQ